MTLSGILQADAYGAYGDLYTPTLQLAPVIEARFWAHAQRQSFELADVEATAHKKARGERPRSVRTLALEAVLRIDANFAIERDLLGLRLGDRQAVRQAHSKSLVEDPAAWINAARETLTTSPRRQLHAPPMDLVHSLAG